MILCSENIKNESNSQQVLLAGDKVMPEMHLRQLEFPYGLCRPFTKNREYKSSQKQQAEDTSIKMN